MICSKCGHEVPDGEEYCQFCGFKTNDTAENEETTSKSGRNDKIIIFAIIAIFFLIIGIYFVKSAVDKRRTNERVEKAVQQSAEEIRVIYDDFQKDAEDIVK